ncbi:Nitrilotriacetate monooxygenase component A/pristinamycin IIA synthase subunit A [Thozetella sp. PMI_491]|nr:Nitrilotriacetate monooxygenase component A/pristinamycin IIA synthase subunit A [Thozetella sp. PMI_491]
MSSTEVPTARHGQADKNGQSGNKAKKQILLNAFDMFTVGHLFFGQWQNPNDKGDTKRDLSYWIEFAKLLERGGINCLFLADTYGGYDTYQDSLDECVRRATQWPVMDPVIPISAMAAVTKNLAFGITASTSFEAPFQLARRFSTLDHLTKGRLGWNIVTSWKKGAFKAIGLNTPIEHDERYRQADEYMRLMYKLWEGSWADDAIVRDRKNDIYSDPDKVRAIRHQGKYFQVDSRFIVDPTPQRTPFLFQAGTSTAGIDFASTHAEAVFLGGHSPEAVKPKVAKIKAAAAAKGRDPESLKFFVTVTPIIGRTEEEAKAKQEELKKYASIVGGLVFISGVTGIDLSKIPMDQEITAEDSGEANKVRSHLETILKATKEGDTKLTPRTIAEKVATGTMSPVLVGTAATVADKLEEWITGGDLDGFNLVHATMFGSFEDVVDLLVPELRKRGLYPEPCAEDEKPWTQREKVYGRGQRHLRDDHFGSRYKYDVYKEEPPYQPPGPHTRGKKRKAMPDQ